MGQVIMENGSKMKDMEKELKKDLMQVRTMGNFEDNLDFLKSKRGMVKEDLNLKMEVFMRVNFKMENS